MEACWNVLFRSFRVILTGFRASTAVFCSFSSVSVSFLVGGNGGGGGRELAVFSWVYSGGVGWE